MASKNRLTNDYVQPILTVGPLGGIDPTTAPYYVAPTNVVDAENITPNSSYGAYQTVLGRVNGFTGTLPGTVRGITKMTRLGQPDLYIFACDNAFTGATAGELYYAEYGGGFTQLTLPVTLTPGNRTSFAQQSKWIFMTNGVDTPIKIDTSLNVTLWGIAAPTTAPTLTATGSGGLLGTYYYCTTFGNSSQESSQSTVNAGPITVTNQGIQLTNIPVSTDPQVTERNIYRLGGSLGQWQLVATISDNTTTTYTDTTADANLSPIVLVPRRDPPPAFYAIANYQERIFGFGSEADPSGVYWSNYGEPYAFNLDTNVQAAGDNSFGDIAVACTDLSSMLLLNKTYRLYAVYGSTDADFQTVHIANVGCASADSVANAYGQAWWLAQDRAVWTFTGPGGLQNISDGQYQVSNIKSVLLSTTPADRSASTAFVYDRMYHISFPTFGKTYFIDTRINQWFKLGFATNKPFQDLEGLYPVIAANTSANGEIDSWFQATTDLGENITSYILSRITDAGDLAATKTVRYVTVQAPPQPGATVTVQLIANPGLQQQVFTYTYNLGTPNPGDIPTRHQISAPMSMKGFEFQLKMIVISNISTIIEKVTADGFIDRKYIQPG